MNLDILKNKKRTIIIALLAFIFCCSIICSVTAADNVSCVNVVNETVVNETLTVEVNNTNINTVEDCNKQLEDNNNTIIEENSTSEDFSNNTIDKYNDSVVFDKYQEIDTQNNDLFNQIDTQKQNWFDEVDREADVKLFEDTIEGIAIIGGCALLGSHIGPIGTGMGAVIGVIIYILKVNFM